MTEECLYEGNEYVKKYDFQIFTENKESFFQSEKKCSLFFVENVFYLKKTCATIFQFIKIPSKKRFFLVIFLVKKDENI